MCWAAVEVVPNTLYPTAFAVPYHLSKVGWMMCLQQLFVQVNRT